MDPVYGGLWAEIEALVNRGGKRLRPLLVIIAYSGYGGKDETVMLDIAVSQELFHAFALIHDDIIDRDLERWGGPNIAGRYVKIYQDLGESEARHYAEGAALLAGDLCLNLANQTLLNSGSDAELLHKALVLTQQALFEMAGGELMDIELIIHKPQNEAFRLKTYRYKTAAYSFRAPLQLGASLASASNTELKKIADFAADAGVAYQLQNDREDTLPEPQKRRMELLANRYSTKAKRQLPSLGMTPTASALLAALLSSEP